MDFETTLTRHIAAVKNRDLEELEATIDPEVLLLVSAQGEVTEDPQVFLERYRAWFADDKWAIGATLLNLAEGRDLGIGCFRLHYRPHPDAEEVTSILTLAFARRDDGWRLVLDQNTPCA